MNQPYQIYREYYIRYKNDSTNSKCCFIIDIDFGVHNLVNYGVQSYIDYCKRYGIDLVVQKKINPKYILDEFVRALNKMYYSYTVPQIFFTYQLLQQYNYVMVGAQNDIIIKPQTVNYFENIDNNKSTLCFVEDYSLNINEYFNNPYTLGKKETSVYNYANTLIDEWFNMPHHNIVVSLSHNIFAKVHRQLWNIQGFVQFLQNIVYRADQRGKDLWDAYVYGMVRKIYSDGQFLLANQIVKFKKKYKFQAHIKNYQNYNLESILKIILQPDIQFIHFSGGGISESVTDIRYNRMERVYNFLN